MPRRRPTTRIAALIRAGTEVFLEKGYRRAQIADVARAMGVAPGTIYLYVESKEALFDAVIRASTAPEIVEKLQIPIQTPAQDATLSFIRKALKRESRIESLEAALEASNAVDAAVELERIARELYAKAAQSWLALKLLERSALDWPELAALWFGKHRLRILQQLIRYFEIRMASGDLRKAPNPPAAARLVLEMVAAFAMHCRTDHSSQTRIELDIAEATVIDAIVNAYVPLVKRLPKKAGKGHN
jgi:AcrR family transcriptional regulator